MPRICPECNRPLPVDADKRRMYHGKDSELGSCANNVKVRKDKTAKKNRQAKAGNIKIAGQIREEAISKFQVESEKNRRLRELGYEHDAELEWLNG